jgi:hypothetical protein
LNWQAFVVLALFGLIAVALPAFFDAARIHM